MQQEDEDQKDKDEGPQQSAMQSESLAGAHEQDTELMPQSVKDMSASSVEKPETPPRMASPKSSQPASSAAAGEDAVISNRQDDMPGSMAPLLESVQQGLEEIAEQRAPEALQGSPGVDLSCSLFAVIQDDVLLDAQQHQSSNDSKYSRSMGKYMA